MSGGGPRLLVDLGGVVRAGAALEDLAAGLQQVLTTAARSVRDTEALAGHDTLDRSLGALADELTRAAREPVAALAVLGEQLHLAAAAYREADDALAGHAPRVGW